MKKPVIMMILDGFGLADEKSVGNAITRETSPNIFSYMDKYASTTLIAHGKAVGLLEGQQGNSEAGHLNIGAGRVVEQDVAVVTNAIDDGRFAKNQSFKGAYEHVNEKGSNLHIMGLLTDSHSAHASPDHLYALIDLFKDKVEDIYLHLFTDGRDSPPHSAITHLEKLREKMAENVHIASITGRHYAMDRNKDWAKTEKVYDLLVEGKAEFKAETAESAISMAYNRGETDEYIEPTLITKKDSKHISISDGDSIVFFNSRSDRARQLVKAFIQPGFDEKNPGTFKRKEVLEDIFFVGMSEYGPDLSDAQIAFVSPDIDNCLAKAIGEEYSQLFISETEKYAHVTYFLNGGYPNPINGEERELVHSSGEKNYAKKPEMETKLVADRILSYLSESKYDFVCVNFPNADMVGHTGDFEAAKKAISILDQQIKRLVDAYLEKDGIVVITSDHGNAEKMIHPETKEKMTEHTDSPVPFILVGDEFDGKKLREGGSLIDVAPTVLDILEKQKPEEMTGISLIKK